MEIPLGDPRRLDLDRIVAASHAETGLTDMGEPDILPALRRLIDSLLNEAHLHAQGVEMQRATLINLLSNRLRLASSFFVIINNNSRPDAGWTRRFVL